MNPLACRLTPLAAASLLGVLPLVAVHGAAMAEEGEPEVVTITNLDSPGWEIQSDPVGDAGIGFVPAPDVDLEAHPAPPGNLLLVTGDPEVDVPPVEAPEVEAPEADARAAETEHVADVGTARITNTVDVAGTPLDKLTLGYSTLMTERPDGSQVAPYLILSVELAAPETDDPTPVPTTLVFEPQFSGTVSQNQWQGWDATADEAVWWTRVPIPSTATPLCLPGVEDPGNNLLRCNWDEITFAHGEATVTSLSIGIGDPLRSGDSAWTDVEAHTDALLVGKGSPPDRVYDFEHEQELPGSGDGHDAFALGISCSDAEFSADHCIWRFDLSNPLTAPSGIEVEGIEESGESLVGIDFHPVSGSLFGVTRFSTSTSPMGRVYDLGAVDQGTLTAEPVTPVPFPLETG